MNAMVLDSCVVAKWFLPEDGSDKARLLRDESKASGKELIVLDIAFAEIANAIWKRQRRGLTLIQEAENILKMLQSFPFRREKSEPLLDAAFAIAVKYDRSVYDALFLALAQKHSARAITSDEPMFNAVRHDFPQLELLRQI